MKRVYKIIILFFCIFLAGVFSFIGYINYSMDKTEEVRAADADKNTNQSAVKTKFIF